MTTRGSPGRAPGWLSRHMDSVPRGEAWLSDAERGLAAAMRHGRRRDGYLLRRWAGKQAVAAVAGLPGEHAVLARVEVRNAADGAPEVYLDGVPWGTAISLSDRAGWAVCATAGDRGAVGCDVELVEPRSPAFVQDFLTEAEQRYVAAAPDAPVAANLMWSAKESALKVLRTGLRRDTRSVEVTASGIGEGWSPLRVHTVEGATLPGWWRRTGALLITVVTTGPTPPPVALSHPVDLDARCAGVRARLAAGR